MGNEALSITKFGGTGFFINVIAIDTKCQQSHLLLPSKKKKTITLTTKCHNNHT